MRLDSVRRLARSVLVQSIVRSVSPRGSRRTCAVTASCHRRTRRPRRSRPSSAPVQRIVSSPERGRPGRRRPRPRGTAPAGPGTGPPRRAWRRRRRSSTRKLADRVRRSRSTMTAACSRTLTGGACRWSRPTIGGGLGIIARAAITASCSGVIPSTSSGSSCGELWLHRRRRGDPRRPRRPSARRSVAATSLNARYCSSRANSRSRASSRARSSSSSTSAAGSSRAALRSSRVAATTRNSLASAEVPVRGPWARM